MKNLTKELIKLLKSVSTHGLPNIFRTKYLPIRLVWIFLTIVSIIITIILVIQTFTEYFEYRVNIDYRLIESNDEETPIILICNKNKLSTKYGYEYLKSIIKKSNSSNNLHPFWKSYDIVKYLIKNLQAYELFYGLSWNEIKNSTKSFDEMFISAFSKLNLLNRSHFDWIFNKRYGNCFRLNFNSNIKFSNGMDNGVRIELFLGQMNELNKLGIEKGIYLSILDKSTNPFNDLDHVINVKAGVETLIQINKEIYEKYPYPYSNCKIVEPSESIYYDEIIKSNYSYSKSLCLDYCYLDLLKKRDNCSLLMNSIHFIENHQNESYCKNESFNFFNLWLLFSGVNLKFCQEQCPFECKQIKYSSYVTTNKYDFTLKMQNDSMIDWSTMIEDKSRPENDFVYLNIHFHTLNYIHYEEIPAVSFINFISNLGGVISLFLGK